ncbi:DMT family transporter [Ferrimonas pelagia]|uniref:DMT family transporter n=1 Tax=Ferrimonas pelagia TaxID=1177826 RepID=A0ABP9FER5_9GAMM
MPSSTPLKLHGFAALHTSVRHQLDARLPARQQGILLALLSTALFVVVGALVRLLSDTIDPFQTLLFRQLVFIAVLLPAIYRGWETLRRPTQRTLHLIRITGAFFALYLGIVTVSHLPLADATALGFTKVLFVALIARLFLSEPVGAVRQFTLLVGFAGVMMMVRPGFEQASWLYTFIGLGADLAAAVAVICVRKMAQSQPRIAILSYQAVWVGVIALLPALSRWQWPSPVELALLFLVGLLSSAGQWIGVTAYQKGEANVIANVEYAQMLYAMALGYVLFGERPDALAILGAALLIASATLPFAFRRYQSRNGH